MGARVGYTNKYHYVCTYYDVFFPFSPIILRISSQNIFAIIFLPSFLKVPPGPGTKVVGAKVTAAPVTKPICGGDMAEKVKTNEYCGYILPGKANNGPFKECLKHKEISAVRLYKACVVDVCGGKTPKLATCENLQELASTCKDKGVEVKKWRGKLCRKS